MEEGPIDELMRQHFLRFGESLEPKWWEGFRWGIKTAYTTVVQLPHDDNIRMILGALEGQSEMSRRRERWCAEEKARKKPLAAVRNIFKRKPKKDKPEPANEGSGPDTPKAG